MIPNLAYDESSFKLNGKNVKLNAKLAVVEAALKISSRRSRSCKARRVALAARRNQGSSEPNGS
jgi:hypothetical protein